MNGIFGRPGRGAVDKILDAANQVADAHRTLDAIRKLHQIVAGPDGQTFCVHCCLNRVSERRFSCHANHEHRCGTAPCPTLALLNPKDQM